LWSDGNVTVERYTKMETKTPLELISDTDRYTLSVQELATVLDVAKSTITTAVKTTGKVFDGLPVIYINKTMRFSLPLLRAALGYKVPNKPQPKQLPANAQPLVDLANYVADVADLMSASQRKYVLGRQSKRMIWVTDQQITITEEKNGN